MKSALLDLFNAEIISPLVTALGHSIWQSAIAGLLLIVAFRAIGIRRPAARYAAALIALGGCMTAFLITFASLNYTPPPKSVPDLSRASSVPIETTASPITPKAVSSAATYPISPRQPSWETPVFCLWIVGVLILLLRAFLRQRALTKFRSAAKPVTSPAIHQLLASVQALLRATRPVLLLQRDYLRSPAIAGFLRPVIFLPATMLARDEVAHLRCHDCLVNLAQMVIESLFFFNPGIWWISRQLREEREAACDQLASDAIGSPEPYAASLLAWIETSNPTTPSIALAADGTGTTQLGSRLRRLLGSSERQIPFHNLVIGTLVALLGFAAVRASANAEHWLSALIELRSNFVEEEPEPEVLTTTLTGRVVAPNGEPPIVSGRDDYVIWLDSQITRHGFAYRNGRVSHSGKFRYAPTKPVRALAWFKGYAPLYTAPFLVDTKLINDGLTLQLEEGFAYHVQVNDPQGKPLDNAEVTYDYNYLSDFSVPRRTDSAGRCTIDKVIDARMRIHVRRAEFEPYSTSVLAPKENGTCFISLKPATHAVARIGDRDTGLPISGSTVKILGSSAPEVKVKKVFASAREP